MNESRFNATRGFRLSAVAHGIIGSAGSALLLSLASAPVARAQAAEAHSALEEVLVTARRREESAQSVPLVVTAINGDDLHSSGIDRFEDLMKVVPALAINDATGRRNVPNYAIRAIRPSESLFGQDPSVVPYFADVVLAPAEGSNLALYDLQSVQVLKGPQGTLFGRNTNGGAVLFTPTRPGNDFGGTVSAGFGNYNTLESEFGVDMPVSAQFRTRLSGKTFKKDGHQTNVLTGQSMGGEDTQAARLSAVWDITDQIENYTVVSYDRARNEGRAAVIVAVNPVSAGLNATGLLTEITASLARQRARGDIDRVEANSLSQYGSRGAFEDIDVWAGFNTTTFELGGELTLKNIAGYRYVKYESAFDADGSSAPMVLDTRQPTTLHHFSEEIQLLGTALDRRLNWQMGLYYYHEQGDQFADGRVLGGTQYVGGSMDNDSYSMFAQGTYAFTPVWSLTLGGRYTQDEKSIVSVNRTATQCNIFQTDGVRLPLNSCSRGASEDFSSPTGTVSLEYKPTDNALVYVASRYGYRAGGFNVRATLNATFEPFEPEYVTDVELGSKLDWSLGDWQLRTNVALFHQWYKDIQRSVSATAIIPPATTPVVVTAIQNAAKAKVNGAELEATIMPTEGLSLRIAYAYLDPEYEEWFDTILVGGVPQQRDLSATPFQYIPKHQGSATLRYEWPLGTNAGTIALQGTYSAQSEVFTNGLGTIVDMQGLPQDVYDSLIRESFDQVDLNVTWSEVLGSQLEMAAYVKNATDDRHIVGSVSSYKAIGYNQQVFNDPRTYGAQLRYRF